MSFEVELTKVSQDVNLSNGQTENFVIFKLPNGSLIRARVNEQAASAVMDSFVNRERAATQIDQENETFAPPSLEGWPGPLPSNGFHETIAPNGEPVLEFGGNGAEPLAPLPRMRPRHVSADASGNPVVMGGDPGEIASSSDGTDEDGVGQV